DSGNQLEVISDAGTLNLANNWLKPGWVNSFAGGYTGTVNGGVTSITGTAPGFINPAQQNFRLASGSACINAGTALHPSATADHAPVREYRKPRQSDVRRPIGVADLGAFELDPFTAWRGEQFPSEAENDLISGEAADPDGDLIRNLVEFAFSLDPHIASTAGLPRPTWVDIGNDAHFAVEFQRRPPPTGLIYATRVTADLAGWSPGCEYTDAGLVAATAQTSDASNPTWTRVHLNAPAGSHPHRFISVTIRRE
ncbi:MAG TPA: hypothetical protein DCY13_06790, partial [Verrucomicrobiales bacterium]|nr:hypothetical protein [Verrucomicrobiales bacterium]